MKSCKYYFDTEALYASGGTLKVEHTCFTQIKQYLTVSETVSHDRCSDGAVDLYYSICIIYLLQQPSLTKSGNTDNIS